MAELYSPRMRQFANMTEAALAEYMPDGNLPQGTVCRAMAYACEAGGKRLRPVLLLSFVQLCGGNPEAAVPFAAAMEMIHSYSLVHDDLPCMDNSLLRRGVPSTFAAFGEDMALLAGDGLLTRAFEVMLSPSAVQGVSLQAALEAAHTLADAAGIMGMVGGQTIDLQSEGQPLTLPQLQRLQEGKTAALIEAACVMGVILGGGSEEQKQAARTFGHELGLGFQIVDDILDVTATAEQLGKPTGGDEQHDKVTYVSLLGLQAAKELATQRTAAAEQALTAFSDTEELLELTRQLLYRDH